MTAIKLTGTVKWFSAAKGWGYIKYDENKEVFVHQSDINYLGYRILFNEEKVEFFFR